MKKTNLSDSTQCVLDVISSRITFIAPKVLTKNKMLLSVEKYHASLDWEYGYPSAQLVFSAECSENGTIYSINYISGTKNTNLAVYSNGKHEIRLPDKSWLNYYRIAHTLGYDFSKKRKINCYVLMEDLAYRNQLKGDELLLFKEISELYEGKDVFFSMQNIDPPLYKFLSKFTII